MEEEETPSLDISEQEKSKKRVLADISNSVPAKKRLIFKEDAPQTPCMVKEKEIESNVTNLFWKGLPLLPEELLIYVCLRLFFPKAPYKLYSIEKYEPITSLVKKIFDIELKNKHLYNYIYRSKNNVVKNLGKTNRGHLRWVEFRRHIENFREKHETKLAALLNQSSEPNSEMLGHLENELTEMCATANKCFNEDFKIEDLSKIDFKASFPSWRYEHDKENCAAHFYHFTSKGYPQIEIIISESTKAWELYFEGKKRSIDLSWCNVPEKIQSFTDLEIMLRDLQRLKKCPAVEFGKFGDLFCSNESGIAFKTTLREPAGYIETLPSQFHKKVIRSAKCTIFLPSMDTAGNSPCDSCNKSEHYLRTLRSRSITAKSIEEKQSKFKRLDQMEHDELLKTARETSQKYKLMHDKVRRLDAYKSKMENVGSTTNEDLTQLFGDLQKALKDKRSMCESPVCKWDSCKKQFCSCEELLDHTKTHIGIQNDIAPNLRNYNCKWENCNKSYQKKKLLENHLVSHTGDARTHFFEILLNDQAKALNTESRQMRWHPVIIRWCLRLYNKSHSSYNALQNSGFLKLPTGRTLSDYKNFDKPGAGWNVNQLGEMKKRYEEINLNGSASLGGLFFDEVKVKEGLVFDPSSWELIGFTDLGTDDDDLNGLLKGDGSEHSSGNGLATHVLQFFFKSLFANFEYPCAYFLTTGIKSPKLNKLFWEGVSLLHSHNFVVLLVCCDGAAANRAFMKMNTKCGDATSVGYNFFSHHPLFMLSDPPHLIKKLRNNLSGSGFSDKCARLLKNNGSLILWRHVEAAYDREKQRRARYTKLTSAHVHLDNLSKMRVKLAVETLSREVADDMAVNDNDNTSETQRYINICSDLFKVFNSKLPLSSIDDERLHTLQGAMHYFTSWKASLSTESKRAQVASFITSETMFDLQVSSPF